MEIYASNSHVVYLAILRALGRKKVRIPALSPTFFATGAKLLGLEVELADMRLDFGAKGVDVAHNFFETHTPKADVIFQGGGKSVGEARVFVKKSPGCLRIECDDELGEKIILFLNGGVRPGRLWNYDLVDVGIKDRGRPCEADTALLERQNEVARHFDAAFAKNPYFDTLKVGEATIKSGYPILLKPALYCPKEDIYTELRERGVDVQVRFKPLYRTSLLAGESLPASEELYKAVLILPFEKEAADVVMEVMERYRYRGCSF